MRRQLQGIGIMVMSVFLTISFENNEWRFVDMFMATVEWSHIFMATGVIGFIMLFLPEKKDK